MAITAFLQTSSHVQYFCGSESTVISHDIGIAVGLDVNNTSMCSLINLTCFVYNNYELFLFQRYNSGLAKLIVRIVKKNNC